MTREEFYEKYGTAVVKFESYYKAVFVFAGEYEGGKISVEVGGSLDDIYRLDVANGYEETVAGLEPFSGSYVKSDKEVDSFYDY